MSIIVIRKSTLQIKPSVMVDKHLKHRLDMRTQQAKLTYKELLRLCQYVLGREIKDISELKMSEAHIMLDVVEKKEKENMIEKCREKEGL